MQTIKSLPVGSKVKFGTYKGEDLVWYIAHKDYPDVPESSVLLLCAKDLGPKEMVYGTNGTNSQTANYNYYVDTGYVHKWLNSNSSNWGSPGNLGYSNEPGFLANFSATAQEKIINLNVKFSSYLGSWYKTVQCKVFPPSYKMMTGNYAGVSINTPVYVSDSLKLDLFNTMSFTDASKVWKSTFYTRDTWLYYSMVQCGYDATLRAGTSSYEVIQEGNTVQKSLYTMIALKADIKVSDSVGPNGYYLTEYDNAAPVITDSDRTLGNKTSAFTVPYTVTDANSDQVTVSEILNGTSIRTYTATLGQENIFEITQSIFSGLVLGTHTMKIEANDGKEKTTRTFTFVKSNSAPIISDVNRDLGDKTASFTLSYTVTDAENNTVTVKEYLDSMLIKSFTASLGYSNTLTVSQSDFGNLQLGSHSLKIEASDGQATSERIFTFRKMNTPPSISGTDKNLLGKSSAFNVSYTVTDAESTSVTVVEKIDTKTLKTYEATSGTQNTLIVSASIFSDLELGNHEITITATDASGLSTVRTFQFQKIDTFIKFERKIAKDMGSYKKILFVPYWKVPAGANIKVEACNNGFDINPSWEDITSKVLSGQYYTFVNATKTNSLWGFNYRVYIDKGTSSDSCVVKRIGVLFA